MKNTTKGISIMLAILMILSSFALFSASADTQTGGGDNPENTDPVSSDINSTDPVNSDLNNPDSSESQPTDPSSSEQTSSESQPTDPSSSEQTSSESQATDPSSSEQTSSESQPTAPSSSEQTSSESVPPSSSETAPTKPTTPTKPVTYKLSKAKVASIPDKAYTGKAITPSVKVTYGKKTLAKGKDYTLTYKNNKKIGTATVEIKGKGSYTGTIKKTFKIVKAANPMTVKVTTKTVSYKKALKARQKVSAITVTKAQGKVSFKKTKGSPNLTISSKGVVSVKQGTQKGTRHMLVKISAAGNANYKPVTKVVAITIIIK